MNKDREIIDGIANGDTKTLTQFYNRNYKIIRKLIFSNSGNEEDLEDVFQDSLLLIYQKIVNKNLNIDCSIHTYFYAICKNIWYSKLRKRNKTFYYSEMKIEEKVVDIFDINFELKNKEDLFRKYYLKLEINCRQLLDMIFEGQKPKEISKKLNISEGNVRKKKFDCKKRLFDIIKKDPLYVEITKTLDK